MICCWIICLTAVPALSQDDAPGDRDSLRPAVFLGGWGPALQSLAVPGWGQAAQGRWWRGGVYFVGEAVLAVQAYRFWEQQYDRPDSDAPGRIYDQNLAYGLAVWYGLGALFAAGDAYYEATGKRETRPTRAAVRSVLFPGWGQLSNGKFWKGAVIFTGQSALAFSAYLQHQRFRYNAAHGETSAADFYQNDRNRLLWWLAGSMVYSAADAFVDAHLRKWDVSEVALEPVFSPESRSLGLGVRVSW
ncbi:MAG: hypothetical protein C4524_06270 [Candidatus Zixiibacteriota bacterium]|nr:MAG: hypothetical protein C4524_06270 [candidate division Zixibacteria bacterium]